MVQRTSTPEAADEGGPTATLSTARFDACLFDLDGVITDTASVHLQAWRALFDPFLATHGQADAPFTDDDYRQYVDGRARVDGVTDFLASRGIHLDPGRPEDPPDGTSAWALANRKNRLFLETLAHVGLRTFPSTAALARRLRAAGVRTAVVTASRNAEAILASAGLTDLFDTRVDGLDAARLGLAGKPAPDTFLEAASRLGVLPGRAVVVEDALAGVEAGRRGGFGLVVGVDRVGQREELAAHGADVVVADLADLAVDAHTQAPADTCALCAGVEPSEWQLEYRDPDPATAGTREALLTLANGYLATRGARPETTSDGVHYPGTYVAGIYNRLTSRVNGRERDDESMVNLPNWLPVTFRVQGEGWFGAGYGEVTHEHEVLDVLCGVLYREALVADAAGRHTRIRQRRLVSMHASHVAALETVIIPVDWSGTLTVRSVIDGRVVNDNVAAFTGLANRHLQVTGTGRQGDGETVWLVARTTQSAIRVATAVRTRLRDVAGDPAATGQRRPVGDGGHLGDDLTVQVAAGQPVTLDKVAAVFTSRDHAISEPLDAALDEVAQAGDFDSLLVPHARSWGQLWRRFRLGVTDGEHVQRAVDVHTFHVLQTLSPHTGDLDAGVPARGLHGEGYRGHVFWDELFVFPLLNFRLPELTRALLLYRYRRLGQARRLAAKNGRRGAQFAWQSGSDGREETPEFFYNPRSQRWMDDHSRRQYHVNLAVAYNVWQYWQVTGDLGFLAAYGAELLVEIARFWSSVAVYDGSTDRYDISGVMGPDEFHDGYPDRPGEGLDNVAYVNVMVSWTLARALEAHDVLGHHHCAELWERLELTAEERARWDHLRRRLRVPFLEGGLLAQFDGYGDLAELDWDGYRAKYGNIGRLDLILEAEGDSTNRYQASKQADVLMLFYLFSAEELTELLHDLGYPFDPESIPATVDYYLARTSHGSTLSRVVNSWVLARTDRARSWQLLTEALQADLADTQGGTTREGIHLGAMAGTIDLLQRCYTSLEARGDMLGFNPQLPARLRELEMELLYRGQWLTVHVHDGELTLHSLPCAAAPIRIAFDGAVHELRPGQRLRLGSAGPAGSSGGSGSS